MMQFNPYDKGLTEWSDNKDVMKMSSPEAAAARAKAEEVKAAYLKGLAEKKEREEDDEIKKPEGQGFLKKLLGKKDKEPEIIS